MFTIGKQVLRLLLPVLIAVAPLGCVTVEKSDQPKTVIIEKQPTKEVIIEKHDSQPKTEVNVNTK